MAFEEDLNHGVERALDKVLIRNLMCKTFIGVDRWEKEKKQMVAINLTMWTNVRQAGAADCLTSSHNYGKCSGAALNFVEQSHFKTVEGLATRVAQLLVTKYGVAKVTVEVDKIAALLYAKAAGVIITRTALDFPNGFRRFHREKIDISVALTDFTFEAEEGPRSHGEDCIRITDILVRCIIGMNACERKEKQSVVINLWAYTDLSRPGWEDRVSDSLDCRALSREVIAFAEQSEYKTLEAFTTAVASVCVQNVHLLSVTVRAQKPCALLFAESSGVEITRTKQDFEGLPRQ